MPKIVYLKLVSILPTVSLFTIEFCFDLFIAISAVTIDILTGLVIGNLVNRLVRASQYLGCFGVLTISMPISTYGEWNHSILATGCFKIIAGCPCMYTIVYDISIKQLYHF